MKNQMKTGRREHACGKKGHAAKTHREGPACTMEPRGTAAGGRI